MNSTAKKALKYTLLPEIGLQMRAMLSGGFSFISMYIAQIYASARLLPHNHPYLNPANRGRFSILQVVAAAGGGLSFKKENIDQIIIFLLMLIGLVVLAIQFMALAFALFIQAAHATALPLSFAGFFLTPAPVTNDVAFVLLDRVFGVPQMFTDAGGVNGTCVSTPAATGAACFSTATLVGGNPNAQPEGAFPWPMHIALRAVMQFYSIGLLIVGTLIFLYFVVAVVMETAQDGVPFGRRFNHVWAPIRMVVALGLLIPVANGLNAAQYITLYAAKWGSGFATNGWNLFLYNAGVLPSVAGGLTPLGPTVNLVASPAPPQMTDLIEFATVLQTCWGSYAGAISDPPGGISIRSYLVKPEGGGGPGSRLLLQSGVDFDQAVRFSNYHDLYVRFGECSYTDSTVPNPLTSLCDTGVTLGGPPSIPQGCTGVAPCTQNFAGEMGNVKPTCGEVVVPVTQSLDNQIATNPDPGAYFMNQQYYELVLQLWMGTYYTASGACAPATLTGRSCWEVGAAAPAPSVVGCPLGTNVTTAGGVNGFGVLEQWGLCYEARYADEPPNDQAPLPDNADAKRLVDMGTGAGGLGYFEKQVMQIMQSAITLQQNSTYWQFNNLQQLGWGGAGIWYSRVAQLNGSMIDAVNSMPHVKSYPMIMEQVMKGRSKSDKTTAGRELFRPVFSNEAIDSALQEEPHAIPIAKAMFHAYDLWREATDVRTTGNWVYDLMNALLGTQGLFALRDPLNQNVHPLALLVGVGKSMLDTAVRNLAVAAGGAILARIMNEGVAHEIIAMISNSAWYLGIAGIGIGIMLYYVVPFMPFLYFFFAVGTWVKGLFEAMVGVPLWALAHIHIDGDGLPGSFAISGYYMLMEVFLRPILIIFGLLASIVIFSAQVRVMNDIWPLVTSNLTGYNSGTYGAPPAPGSGEVGELGFFRDSLDQFFFTVIYAVVVYMMCMASFKLIARIPDKVMRWMGANVDAFNDQEDIAKGLMGKMQVGISTASSKLTNTFELSGRGRQP